MNPPCYLSQFLASVVSYLQLFPDFATAIAGYAPLSTIVGGVVQTDPANGYPLSVIMQKVRGQFQTNLLARINSLGIVAQVEIISFKESAAQDIMATFDPVVFVVDAQEMTVVNSSTTGGGTGWPAMDFIERSIAALKLWKPPTSVSGGLYPARISSRGAENVATVEEAAQGLSHWKAYFDCKISTTPRATP